VGQAVSPARRAKPTLRGLWGRNHIELNHAMLYPGRTPLSARNQFRGQIKDVKLGDVMAHIVVQVGDNEVESVITRRSAEELNLKIGDSVTVVIKSTEVMIQK
jgi:molybdopterin-binding protein